VLFVKYETPNLFLADPKKLSGRELKVSPFFYSIQCKSNKRKHKFQCTAFDSGLLRNLFRMSTNRRPPPTEICCWVFSCVAGAFISFHTFADSTGQRQGVVHHLSVDSARNAVYEIRCLGPVMLKDGVYDQRAEVASSGHPIRRQVPCAIWPQHRRHD
jgi:hypothetical protein